MSINVAELRAKTQAAIASGQEKARLLAEQIKEKERLKAVANQRKAQNVIDQIPGRAEKEASAGRSHAIVMSVEYGDYTRPHGSNDWRILDPKWLNGACEIVFKYCVEAGLSPTLEDWHDGVGMNSGHNIVIHW